MDNNNTKSVVQKNSVVLKKEESEEWETYSIGEVAKTLHTGMTKLLEKEVSPASLNACANCAQQITNIVRLHIEAKRIKQKMKGPQ